MDYEGDDEDPKYIFSNYTDPESEEQSLLLLIGYNANKNGLQGDDRERRRLLTNIFSFTLQNRRGEDFHGVWGQPHTEQRKQKITGLLWSLIHRGSNNPRMSEAIDCWVGDKQWVENNLHPPRPVPRRRGVSSKIVRGRLSLETDGDALISQSPKNSDLVLFNTSKEVDALISQLLAPNNNEPNRNPKPSVFVPHIFPTKNIDNNKEDIQTMKKNETLEDILLQVVDALAIAREIKHPVLQETLLNVLFGLRSYTTYTPGTTYIFGQQDCTHELVCIPKGTFEMGALKGDGDAWDYEKPRHQVTISRDLLVGKYPVTQGLYERVMGKNPSAFTGSTRPVENVSWYDAVSFCNKLSALEGREAVYTINGDDVRCNFGAKGYRLLTEAEWEYCAKSGQRFKYSGSDDVDEVAWYETRRGETHPVGLKKPNGFGLYDMSGNVWEWVWDFWGDYSSGTQVDPQGPTSGSARVRRGGSWNDGPESLRVSDRRGNSPVNRDYDLGFRLGLTP